VDSLLTAIRAIVDTRRAASARRAALGESLRVVCHTLAERRGPPVSFDIKLSAQQVTQLRQLTGAIIDRDPAWLLNPAEQLGELYQRLLADSRSTRRATGCYYTPSTLVDQLLDAALTPMLDRLADQPDRKAALLDIKVCDPACGSGRFLVAVARRLADRLNAWQGTNDKATALNDVVTHCIYGIDCDPLAVELARFSLQCLTSTAVESHVHVGDSLRGDVTPTYDLIIGNPPFVNMIDGGLSASAKRSLSGRAHGLGGTADLAYHFVARAHELTKPSGRIAFILPKSFLNAPSASRLRATLSAERSPTAIIVPEGERHFRGAATYVCALVLGGEQPCRISMSGNERDQTWPTTTDDPQQNWWRFINTAPALVRFPSTNVSATLGELFTITAGMTTGEAYAIREHLRDDPTADCRRLITSRLIDPDRCRWGEVACRYLGSTYTHPVLRANSTFAAGLQRRLQAACRPKLLIAGLANRLEAYLDAKGSDLGAVSTWAVFHPHDDLNALRQLCDWLHSTSANEWLRAELGAASVGHGYMTITKRALQQMPLGHSFIGVAA
jgi:hypothetical protein